ncbi:MAG: hypothetical protein N4A49_04505 [Marinifilaceae bacterium]|jgi:ASC-1-like (ASCH) protein|nr:hypothetical protein [Marinifilaceae bacterium]
MDDVQVMNQKKSSEIAEKIVRNSKNHYDYLTRGLNNKNLVSALYKGEQDYIKAVSSIRKVSTGFFVAGLAADVMFSLLQGEDPVLKAIQALTEKIDELSKHLDQTTQRIENVTNAIPFKTALNECKVRYNKIIRKYNNITNFDSKLEDNLALSEFMNEVDNIEDVMARIAELFTSSEAGLHNTIASSFGNLGELYAYSDILLEMFDRMKCCLLAGRILQARKSKINASDQIIFEKNYTDLLNKDKEFYDATTNTMIKRIMNMSLEVTNKQKSFLKDYIDTKKIRKITVSKDSCTDLLNKLEKMYPFQSFFVAIYTPTKGDTQHSIGPKNGPKQLKYIKVDIKNSEGNLVVFWWNKQLTETKIKSAHAFNNLYKFTDLTGSNQHKTSEKKVDDRVSSLICFDKNYTNHSKWLAINECGFVNGNKFPLRDNFNLDKKYRITHNTKRCLYYAHSKDLKADLILLYKYHTKSNAYAPQVHKTICTPLVFINPIQ